jgi:toxin ParE1/3/4
MRQKRVGDSPNGVPEAYALTYYPGVVDAKDATTVEVASAMERNAIDVSIPRQQLYRVRGRIIDSRTVNGGVGKGNAQFYKEAIAEGKAVREWYEIRSSASAVAFMEELDRIVGRIREYPDGGAPYLEGTRRYLMQRFPFSVVYRQKRRTLEVVAVARSKRKPGYWKSRVEQ